MTDQTWLKYKQFFKKTGSMLLESKGWHATRYMDFTSRQHDCIRNGCYCINYRNSTYNLLREHESRTHFLHEAVGAVWPYEELVEAFKRFCKQKLDGDFLKLSEKDFGFSSQTIPLVDDIYKDYKDDSAGYVVYNIVTFRFAYYTHADVEPLLKDFIEQAEDMNYGLCKFGHEQSIGRKQPIDGKDLDVYFVTFEAKYNSFQFEFVDWLHHYTSVDSLHSINENGLVPSSANVRFAYEDLVYLFNKATFSDIAGFAQEKAKDEKLAGIAILKISSKKLQEWKDYRDGVAKFYVDTKITNFEMKDARAVYTYDSIPRDLIDNEIMVYDTVSNFTLRNGRKQDLRNF